ncbi:ATP-dependent helicase [Thiomicrospira aerophila AL3]|uniref:ATP-dependent helicase n=1 Tax=Thiomicrospira aerophila AL3 TaxID=717772 RepID=W0DX03_9GAMM|nr:ATP-dependent RNA helicase HrpA [Thiomicrospira aerophila]AHF01514.1 ATP-dependent helicase [Thiomicrospira aerophila AL3]
MSSFPKNPAELFPLITQAQSRDQFRLKRDLKRLNLSADTEQDKQAWLRWCERLQQSLDKVQARKALVPTIHYDAALPVVGRRDELLDLIKNHQVVVIAGETGSGKTTQLPKLCLEAGRGVMGRIGCTQPRRLAARSVAERLAEELGSSLGELVGYQVRFHDQVHETSLIKVMTDGILLAEIQNDRFLSQYDTIIIDEAHERSVNIDFLLGILKQLLPKRPDLKVIITSATIDTARFAEHFKQPGRAVPIVEVSGRTYPVEVRYRPLGQVEMDDGTVIEQDLTDGIIEALDELATHDPFGDVLVFQIGERDIKETAEALRKQNLKNTEVIPLYARLSMSEQNKVFQTSNKRRIILSTNVAETSLTVPGIRYVIDPGLVRISRYSVRSKVQRLPVEKISQASANQRKGRCGRVADGICIRLYSEEDFNARPEFTDPEIHRTSLSSVLLNMAQLKLGKVQNFPFIEPPEEKAVNDGYRQLIEIGALDDKKQLTDAGRDLARLPLEPRIAKMVLEAEKNNVLAEVLIIAAAISIQDPRDINEQTMQAARTKHKQWEDPRSDFLFFLNLWRFYEYQARHLSQNKLRKLCKTNYLSYLRLREWHDLFHQLKVSLKSIGLKVGELHLYEEVTENGQTLERLSDLHSINLHRSLLAGLLGQIMMRDDAQGYLGARGTKLFIHPSSVLFKRKPKWLMSAEMVETSKLYARTNAEIDVRWVEDCAPHLIKRSYADPHWQKKTGQVGAYESVTLYGLPIVSRRVCNYGPINPKDARGIFIRALAQQEVNTRAAFYQHNLKLIENIERYESKLRRPDLLVEEQVLQDFYAARIPEPIYNQPALESWLKKADKKQQEALKLTESDLLKQDLDRQYERDFPDQIQLSQRIPLQLDYRFEPGKQQDGVVFKIPLAGLNLVNESQFEWLTPGFIKEKITCYIKALPKQLRKQFVPAPAVAERVAQQISAEQGEFTPQLIQALNRSAQHKIGLDDFHAVSLPAHLLPWYQLLDDKGKLIAESADLAELKRRYHHLVEAKIQQSGGEKKQAVTEWNFGDLKDHETIKSHGKQLQAYPGLVIEQGQVFLTRSGDERQATKHHGYAVWALLKMQLHDKVKYLQKHLNLKQACLCFAPYGSCAHLTEQIIDKSLRRLVPEPQAIRQHAQFVAALATLKADWVADAQTLAGLVTEILTGHQQLAKQVKGKVNPRWLASMDDIKSQLDGLVNLNFVLETPDTWLKQMPRYLKALQLRLEKLDLDPQKDQHTQRQMLGLLADYDALAQRYGAHPPSELIELRWMLEELRISLFSQPMKTIQTVSINRLQKALAKL